MSTSEFSYIPESPAQSFRNNKGILTPTDIYNLDREDKWTNFGQLEFIETQTITSSTASMIFDSIQETTYDIHFLTYSNFGSTGDNRRLVMRFFESGVEATSNYRYGGNNARTDGNFETGSNGTSSLHLGINGDIDANVRDNGYIYIYNAGDFTKYTMYNAHTTGMFQTTSKFASIFIGGNLSNESQVDQIKLFSSTDNIATLTASLYGIRTYT
tara:strand:+ start:2469 stop:3110 length:642 start_codon:yes stop_codon:yes gene_type:complete